MELRGKDQRTSNDIGNISESAIIARFLQLGYTVLAPHGKKQCYDLIIEDADKRFWRIQCKIATLNEDNSALAFQTSIRNVTGKNRQPRNYRGQCDFFAVYCEKLDKIYLVPVNEVGTIRAQLRLTPARNNQQNGIRWAEDYEL